MNITPSYLHRIRITSLVQYSVIIFLVGLLLVLPFITGLLPTVRFTHEEIDIEVHKTHVRMIGTYHYQNPFPFPVTQGLSIPLPISEDEPSPINIQVRILKPDGDIIPTHFIMGLHRFNLRFSSHETIDILVQYEQHTPNNKARYILTTTQPWRRPLNSGRYRLFANAVTIKESNYPVAPLSENTVGFTKTDFMPPFDWQFIWEPQIQ